MTALFIYIIRWAVTLTLLYSLYGLLLRRETLHIINRGILLFILIASMTLPLCTVETSHPLLVAEEMGKIEQAVTATAMPISGDAVSGTSGDATESYTVLFALIPFAIYSLGLVVVWYRLIHSIISLAWLIYRSKRRTIYNTTVRVSDKVTTPFSFFNWIVISEADAAQDCRSTLAHEKAHVRMLHSMDILLAEATACMLWPIPFVWMLKRDLRDVHEYQADRQVLKQGYSKDEYQQLLVEKVTATGLQPVVNAFNQSSIKKRFKMMYKKPSNRRAALKAVYVVPLAAVAICAFARPHINEEIPHLIGNVEENIKQAGTIIKRSISTVNEEKKAVEQEAIVTEAAVNDLAMNSATEPAKPQPAVKRNTVTTERTPLSILDSTMHAIGARRIAEGVYVGKFKPNFTSDTIRVRSIKLCDTNNTQFKEELLHRNNVSDCYDIRLTALTSSQRQNGRGYHISQMTYNTATKDTDFHGVNNGQLMGDTRLRQATVTKEELIDMKCNFYIEQHPDETHLVLLYPSSGNNSISIDFSQAYILDSKTGDRYMLRRVEGFDSPNITFEGRKTRNSILQFTLVFPPLAKSVRQISFHLPSKNNDYAPTYKLKNVLRNPKRIIK